MLMVFFLRFFFKPEITVLFPPSSKCLRCVTDLGIQPDRADDYRLMGSVIS